MKGYFSFSIFFSGFFSSTFVSAASFVSGASSFFSSSSLMILPLSLDGGCSRQVQPIQAEIRKPRKSL